MSTHTQVRNQPPARAVCLDLETTGVSPDNDRIVQVACVELLDGLRLGATACWLVNPGVPIPPDASAVHGITDDMVRDSPSFSAVADELLAFLADSPIIAHNAKFDLSFLQASLHRLDRPALRNEVIDTLPLLRRVNGLGRASLDAGCRLFGIDLSRRKDRHDALVDAELLAELYGFLIGARKRDLFGLDAMPGVHPPGKRNAFFSKERGARDEIIPDRMLGRPTEEERARHAAWRAAFGLPGLVFGLFLAGCAANPETPTTNQTPADIARIEIRDDSKELSAHDRVILTSQSQRATPTPTPANPSQQAAQAPQAAPPIAATPPLPSAASAPTAGSPSSRDIADHRTLAILASVLGAVPPASPILPPSTPTGDPPTRSSPLLGLLQP